MTAPQIVILDGFTLNPGDNPWTAMNALGHVENYDHSTPEQAIDRCRNATIVVVNKTRLDSTFFRQSPSVRFVAVSATGWDSEMLCYPHTFWCDGQAYLLYNGNAFGRQGFGVAVMERG